MNLQLKNIVRSSQESGMSLLEMLIAMIVLSVGMTSLMFLFLQTSYSNNRNSKDSSGTFLAQMVLEQISAQDPNSTQPITITDCNQTAWTVESTPGAAPNGAGANLVTSSSDLAYGGIDQTQAINNITQNYEMQYTDCPVNGRQVVYDVRWNVMTISANTTRLITVSARPLGAPSSLLGGPRFAIPVTLRGIGGP